MFPLDRMMTIRELIRDKVQYNTPNVFGVIAYTEENPHIVKVLRDKDYWKSLYSRTGNWILYAIKPDSNHSHLTDSYIIPQMGIRARDALPCLIVFAIGPDQCILQREYSIDDSDVATAYGSIEATVSIISNTVRAILPENLSSTNTFREVTKSLEAELAKKQWKRVTSEMQQLFKTLFKISLFVSSL